MAQVMGTGPVQVFIGWGGQNIVGGLPQLGPSRLFYYGTTQSGPDITENSTTYEVTNDLTGPKIPIDRGFAGREDNIVLAMTRWLPLVENAIENYPDQAILGGAQVADGFWNLETLGTMAVAENASFKIYLINSGALRPANIANAGNQNVGMPLGRVYFACIPSGPAKLVIGLKENIRVRSFMAMNVPRINGGFALNNPGNLKLFSEAPADLAPALAIPIS